MVGGGWKVVGREVLVLRKMFLRKARKLKSENFLFIQEIASQEKGQIMSTPPPLLLMHSQTLKAVDLKDN